MNWSSQISLEYGDTRGVVAAHPLPAVINVFLPKRFCLGPMSEAEFAIFPDN